MIKYIQYLQGEKKKFKQFVLGENMNELQDFTGRPTTMGQGNPGKKITIYK